jgi:TRAP-type C4-dicarboxylate transport system substrate-binding protein
MRIALFAALALAAGALNAQELRLLTGFDARYPGYKIVLQRYTEAVEKASGGKVKFRISGPEVINPFQQFEPATKGAFDLLYTVQPYHIGTTSVSFGIYALVPDPDAFRKAGIFDYLDKEYQRFNLRLLAIYPGNKEVGAFHAALREPIAAGGDILGRRVRGNPFFKPLIDKLGAAMVTLPIGEVYPALQRGTIDGAFGPISGSLDYKWHEVGKYSMRPAFGYIYHFLLINTSSFGKLSPELQKIMLDEARKLEIPATQEHDRQILEEDAELRKRGMLITELSPAKAQEAVRALAEGVWETAENSKATGDRAKEFRAFVRKAGLPGLTR